MLTARLIGPCHSVTQWWQTPGMSVGTGGKLRAGVGTRRMGERPGSLEATLRHRLCPQAQMNQHPPDRVFSTNSAGCHWAWRGRGGGGGPWEQTTQCKRGLSLWQTRTLASRSPVHPWMSKLDGRHSVSRQTDSWPSRSANRVRVRLCTVPVAAAPPQEALDPALLSAWPVSNSSLPGKNRRGKHMTRTLSVDFGQTGTGYNKYPSGHRKPFKPTAAQENQPMMQEVLAVPPMVPSHGCHVPWRLDWQGCAPAWVPTSACKSQLQIAGNPLQHYCRDRRSPTHTHTRAHTPTHTCTHTRTRTHPCTPPHTHPRAHTRAHTRTRAHPCAHTHVCTHLCTHTPVHTPPHLHFLTPRGTGAAEPAGQWSLQSPM